MLRALDPGARAVPPLFRAVKRASGIDSVSSDGRTLEVAGWLALAAELEPATGAVCEIVSAGRRTREALAKRELRIEDGWHVEVRLEGTPIVLRRRVPGDVPRSFVAVDETRADRWRPRTSFPRPAPSAWRPRPASSRSSGPSFRTTASHRPHSMPSSASRCGPSAPTAGT